MRIVAPLLTFLCAISLILAGCNSSKEPDGVPPKPTDGTTTTALPQSGDTPQTQTNTPPAGGQWQVRTDAQGRKWFGDVPYDVFFDDPLGVANDNEPVAGVANVMMGSPTPADAKPDSTPDPPATGGALAWETLISAEALDAEVKSIRNFLNPKLQSVGQYNDNLSMIPAQTATLAALADIAAKHPGKITWKADALYIRDLAGAMNAEPLQRGAKFQRKLLGQFEQISDTLNRSRPADLPEPDADASIADSAEMGLLMKRMDLAYNQMKTNAGSEDSFRSSLDMVRRESAIMAILAKTVTGAGYGNEDDEEFIGFADTVAMGGIQIIEAAALENFAEYDKALGAAYNACNQCHMDYK